MRHLRLIFTCGHPALAPEARAAFEQALARARTEPQRRVLRRRLADLSCRFCGPPFVDQVRASAPNPTH